MIPAEIVLLEALPLTPNGKVDRQALPGIDVGATHPGRTGIAPRTALEKVLAEIWQDLLGLDRVSVDDNFFESGGHSLLMIRLQARLSEAFAIEVSMMDLFRCPTIKLLAERLSDAHVAVPTVRRTETDERAEKQRAAILRGQKWAEEREPTGEPQVPHGQSL
jgi:acyl carrier protein